jgi:hypothetical protein
MKKLMIIASAMVFALSTTMMATAQNVTVKTTPHKSTAVANQETQKTTMKTDSKVQTNESKTTADVKHKHHKGKAKGANSKPATPTTNNAEKPKTATNTPAATQIKTAEKKK